MFFAGSQLPRKFVPCFLREGGFLVSSSHVFCRKPASPQVRAMFFPGSWLPRKFVPCFLQEAGFLVSSSHVFCRKPASPQVRSMFFPRSRLPCKFLSCNNHVACERHRTTDETGSRRGARRTASL